MGREKEEGVGQQGCGGPWTARGRGWMLFSESQAPGGRSLDEKLVGRRGDGTRDSAGWCSAEPDVELWQPGAGGGQGPVRSRELGKVASHFFTFFQHVIDVPNATSIMAKTLPFNSDCRAQNCLVSLVSLRCFAALG